MIDAVNFVDLLALLIMGIAIFLGWRSGFVIQAMALGGFVLGIVAVAFLAPSLAGFMVGVDPLIRGVIIVVTIAGIVLVAQALGGAFGAALRRRMGSGVVGSVDTGAGAAFGLVRGVFLVWLMGGLAAALPLASVATEARNSAIVGAIDAHLPSPVMVAAQLGRLIESTGLPDVFVGAPPPADIPAGGPTQKQADQIAAPARGSTLRVGAVACGSLLSGTAFAVTGDRFVTNAHVVAGSSYVWLTSDGSLDQHEAGVVYFDPDLDLAVLAVDGSLGLTPLTFSTSLPTRGENAAALGYTGGGGLRVIPTLISRPIEALGRDIYGNSIVARTVIEMSADVAPGDSGGPVVLPDGSVGGVTFSRSRTEADVGYALSPTEVAADVARAAADGGNADTGACLSGS